MSDVAPVPAVDALQTPVRRPGHRWVKGQSGNPRGPKPRLDIVATVDRSMGRGPMANMLMAAIRNMASIAKDPEHPLCVQATKLLLDKLTSGADSDKAAAPGATVIVLDTGGIRPPTVPATRLAVTVADSSPSVPDGENYGGTGSTTVSP